MSQIVRVVAGLIRKSNTVLIAKRHLSAARGGLWELPGGKVEEGETDAQALQRELHEELGVRVTVSHQFAQTEYLYPDVTIHLVGLECRILSGTATANAHEAIRWIAYEDLCLAELAPADKSLLRC